MNHLNFFSFKDLNRFCRTTTILAFSCRTYLTKTKENSPLTVFKLVARTSRILNHRTFNILTLHILHACRSTFPHHNPKHDQPPRELRSRLNRPQIPHSPICYHSASEIIRVCIFIADLDLK
jgi:hypothetical protein